MTYFRSSSTSTPYTSDSAGTITLNKPAGTVDGDLLVVGFNHTYSPTPGAPFFLSNGPSGWTVDQNGGGTSVMVWHKVAASEPASYTWDVGASSGAFPHWVGFMAAYDFALATATRENIDSTENNDTSYSDLVYTNSADSTFPQLLVSFCSGHLIPPPAYVPAVDSPTIDFEAGITQRDISASYSQARSARRFAFGDEELGNGESRPARTNTIADPAQNFGIVSFTPWKLAGAVCRLHLFAVPGGWTVDTTTLSHTNVDTGVLFTRRGA